MSSPTGTRRWPIAVATASATAVMLAARAVSPRVRQVHDGAEFIRGINNAEDLIRLEGTPWVLTSNLGDRTWARGGFYAVDVRDHSVHALTPDFSGPATGGFVGGDPAPDPMLFSAHGIDVRKTGNNTFGVLAVNHGGRQSVEAFDVTVAGDELPRIVWRGGVAIARGLSGNAVAWLDGDAFVVTIPTQWPDLTTLKKTQRGLPTGFVYRWSGEWTRVPHTDSSITNGIVVSPDRTVAYVNGYTEGTINKVSLTGGGLLDVAHVDFMPDNLRWAPDGTLFATGHAASFLTVQLMTNSTSIPVCPVRTKVVQVDPETMETRLVYDRPAADGFGGGTSAIVVGDDLWVSSFRSQSLLTIPLVKTMVQLR